MRGLKGGKDVWGDSGSRRTRKKVQLSVLPSDTSVSRRFAMGCNRRAVWPDGLEFWSVTGPFQPPRRHGVGKAEREHLQSAGLVVMRQIAARVPAFRGELTFEFGLASLPRGPSQARLCATVSYTRRFIGCR